jgi:signal transduction histidine kinase
VNRVSIWLLENQNGRLVRKFLYELGSESDEMLVLERKDYPTYFDAVETKPFIIASDARVHPDTREFTESYLKPLHIYSMLDCPIVIDRKLFGVICCENQREVKEWNTEDALFIQSLADLISMNFKNERIKTLLVEIRRKNNELTGKNNEILTMNEELRSINEKLSTLNETLEETVRFRTRELETQNTQLTEYAFINSHLLRAPLARILGLSNLLTREDTSVKDAQLIEALHTSSKEMDVIIRKISDILYDGNNLTREDIKVIIDRNLNK